MRCCCGAACDITEADAAEAFIRGHRQHDQLLAALAECDMAALVAQQPLDQLSSSFTSSAAAQQHAASSSPAAVAAAARLPPSAAAALASVLGQSLWCACLAVLMMPAGSQAASLAGWAEAVLSSGELHVSTNTYRPWLPLSLLPSHVQSCQGGSGRALRKARLACRYSRCPSSSCELLQQHAPPTLLHKWLAAPYHSHFITHDPHLSSVNSLVIKDVAAGLAGEDVSGEAVQRALARLLQQHGAPCSVEQLLRVGAWAAWAATSTAGLRAAGPAPAGCCCLHDLAPHNSHAAAAAAV